MKGREAYGKVVRLGRHGERVPEGKDLSGDSLSTGDGDSDSEESQKCRRGDHFGC